MKRNHWHVSIAAEAFAAGIFARYGYDVSVQYGANQPEYDLIISKGERILKVSVKGSQDGSWGLTQSLIKNADYHGAIDKWLAKHSKKTILCLVQFKGVGYEQMPRIYIATPLEIANLLKSEAGGRGDTILYEYHEWKRSKAAGQIDRIPEKWKICEARINEMFT